jgi:hypothetical protein
MATHKGIKVKTKNAVIDRKSPVLAGFLGIAHISSFWHLLINSILKLYG